MLYVCNKVCAMFLSLSLLFPQPRNHSHNSQSSAMSSCFVFSLLCILLLLGKSIFVGIALGDGERSPATDVVDGVVGDVDDVVGSCCTTVASATDIVGGAVGDGGDVVGTAGKTEIGVAGTAGVAGVGVAGTTGVASVGNLFSSSPSSSWSSSLFPDST